ncbi:hypothetical protein GCM10011608_16400 [Micromonospora sonchi]|uniref:LPXTG cell wall anchor domain-containing protein n=1 Tax=Micromonospora sonchi TaxID=1763543 RepID=A0A917TQE8_9ACTN|nr:LPXTG cell wall anchor domain-containing protein [Micromonospora sonchi]GGM32567.1 hypothetical protein GCM10011608_16400 [Micromonospora sonchi]
MIFRNRRAVSMAAAALLASGAFTALGAPAHAAGTETDLAVTTAGTRITSGVEGKLAWIKIANQGKGTPSQVDVLVDLSKVDASRLEIEPFTLGACGINGGPPPESFLCSLSDEEIPGPGETVEVPLIIGNLAKGATEPYSAPVTISIESEGDTDESNNSIEVDIELTPESGVDLGVFVPDVKTRFDFDTGEEGPLRSGDTALLFSATFNWGDVTARGVKLTFQLPKGATFAFPVELCAYSADKRTAVCDEKDLVLEPNMALFYDLPVVVDEGVDAPTALKGGSLKAEALGVLPAGARISAQAKKPASDRAEVRSIDDTEYADVDPSDNVDDFAVIVSAPSDGGGGGGGLPVTGVQAGLIGAVGVGVVLAGVAMFLVARRRRVVVVAPTDEKTND